MENQSINEEIIKNNISFSNKPGFSLNFLFLYVNGLSMKKNNSLKTH